MAKRLTKQMLLDYGINSVEINGSEVIIKRNDQVLKQTNRRISVYNYKKGYKLYKCGWRLSRTQIPVAKVAYVWENGSIEHNQVARYDVKSNRFVAVSYSDLHKEVLLKWARSHKEEEK